MIVFRTGSAEAGKRLDAVLQERLPEYSRSRLQSWIKAGRVLLDGRVTRPSQLLHAEEEIAVTPADPPPLKALPEDLPVNVLYEDADVIVIDKPAGMVVHAGAGHASGTLVNALLHRFGTLSTDDALRPGIVHRLDRGTSGVMVVARNDRAHQSLAAQFHDREVEKVYLTVVHGQMKQPHGRIALPITRDPVRRTRMTARLASGRTALTDYRVLESLGRYGFLEVRIGTGRTHQIRVHLATEGHPVAGDRLYGAPAVPDDSPLFGRFFLHAHRLRFRSPSREEWITVESPLAPELAAFLTLLRQNTARME